MNMTMYAIETLKSSRDVSYAITENARKIHTESNKLLSGINALPKDKIESLALKLLDKINDSGQINADIDKQAAISIDFLLKANPSTTSSPRLPYAKAVGLLAIKPNLLYASAILLRARKASKDILNTIGKKDQVMQQLLRGHKNA